MSLVELIKSCMEDTEPQNKILEEFKANDGKRITERFVGIVSAKCGYVLRLSRGFFTTDIVWKRDDSEQRLVVDNVTTNATIDAKRLVELNPAYFDALVERNRLREELLNNSQLLDEIEASVKQYKLAEKILLDTFERLPVDKHTIAEYYGVG